MKRLIALMIIITCAACTPAMKSSMENIKHATTSEFKQLGTFTKERGGDVWRSMGGDGIVAATGLRYRDASAYHFRDVRRPKEVTPYMPMPQAGVQCEDLRVQRRYVEVNGYWRILEEPICMDSVR